MAIYKQEDDGNWTKTNFDSFLDFETENFPNDNELIILSDRPTDVGAGSDREYESPEIPKPSEPATAVVQTSAIELVEKRQVEEPFVRYGGRDRRASVASLMTEGFEFEPVFPSCFLKMSVFWENVSTFVIRGPQEFTRTISTKEGMSLTELRSLSASLGLKVKVLDVGLSTQLDRSIKISKEKTVSDAYKISVKENETATFTIWQLVEQFDFVDKSDKVFEWSGRIKQDSLKFLSGNGKRIPGFPFVSMRAKFDGATTKNYTSTYAARPITFDIEV